MENTKAETGEGNAPRNTFNAVRQFLAGNHTFELNSEARHLSGDMDVLEAQVIQLQAQRDELLAAIKNALPAIGNYNARTRIEAAIAKAEGGK